MPDRSKRRKNNKTKRKNKNYRPDPSQPNSSANEIACSETCSENNVQCSKIDEQGTKLYAEPAVIEDSVTKSDIERAAPQCAATNLNVEISFTDSAITKPDENAAINTGIVSQYNVDTDTVVTTAVGVANSDKNESKQKQDVSNNIDCDLHKISQDQNNNGNNVQPLSHSMSTADIAEIDAQISECYVVESPENSVKNKCKLNNIKSKSLDNDDAPKIIEISDEASSQTGDENTLAIIESSNILVSDVESDIEWENIDELQENDKCLESQQHATGTLSIITIPLNVAQCDQAKALSPEAEQSLRNYLKTLNLSTHPSDPGSIEIKTEIEQIINREIRQRLRKKGLADDFLFQRLGPPRVLDVIDEEGSSESSVTSRRQSHLSDKKSDVDDLEDDVFEDDKKMKEKYATKSVRTLSQQRQIPQKCVLVGAKMREPEVTEACGDWSMKTVEKLSGAEVVYLTDTSSSTSSIHELADESDDGMETDVSVRMITPTIEVTDTEIMLKKTFIPQADKSAETESNGNYEEKTEIKALTETNGNSNYVSNDHEILVLSTENIKTNLYVKEIDNLENNTNETLESNTKENDSESSTETSKPKDNYDIEIKVLKCELNDAINNLIKEVVSDSETTSNNPKETVTRQDSSSSVGSSQCTAKYNPTYSSLNDVSNMHDETYDIKTITENTRMGDVSSHVKDVFECVTGTTTENKNQDDAKQPSHLRDLCVRKIATFPFGEKILEELASVSKRLQNITVFGTKAPNDLDQKYSRNFTLEEEQTCEDKMPYYPLPDVSMIESVSLETKSKHSVPPPVQPRNSSLKKSQDDHWTGIPTKSEPVYVCLSPSQKMLMEKTNTVLTKEDASQLVDMHRKYVDRRGYNEHKKNESEKEQNAPVVPFKSQTGSRLLALIRDPKVTNNINSTLSKRYNQSLDQMDQSDSRVEKMSKRIRDQFNSIKDFSTSFKPVPPPRPRKYSSSVYESDESSDFTDSSFRSLKSERKFFHYSTGNLTEEIENDVSTIQNMHRYYTNMRDQVNSQNCPRRPSLPKDLCEQQMEYIRQKEKEVEAEIRRLEEKKSNVQPRGPRAPLTTENNVYEEKIVDTDNYYTAHKKDFSFSAKPPDKQEKGKLSAVFSSSQEEILRDKMYSEYVSQMAERQERKQQKVIKITNYPATTSSKTVSKSMPTLDLLDSKVNNRIEKEFICKARERWEKLGIKDPETEDERESGKNVYKEPKVIEHKIKVIEGDKEKDVKKLPNHLQDFVRFTAKDKAQESDGSGESPTGPASPHVVVLCAVLILVLAVSNYFFRLFRNK